MPSRKKTEAGRSLDRGGEKGGLPHVCGTPSVSARESGDSASEEESERGASPRLRRASAAAAITKADLKIWAAEIKDEVAAVKGKIKEAVKEIRQDFADLLGRVEDTERRLGEQEESVTSIHDQMQIVQKDLLDCCAQVEDLENRSRRNNVRIRGVPDTAEYGDATAVVQEIYRFLMADGGAVDATTGGLEVDRAHRTLGPKNGDYPRDIIACIHRFPDKDRMVKKARELGVIPWKNLKVEIFQDLSSITLQKRREFRPLLEVLKKNNVRYRWLFPFGLLVTFNGVHKRVTTVVELQAVLRKEGLVAPGDSVLSESPTRRLERYQWKAVSQRKRGRQSSRPEGETTDRRGAPAADT